MRRDSRKTRLYSAERWASFMAPVLREPIGDGSIEAVKVFLEHDVMESDFFSIYSVPIVDPRYSQDEMQAGDAGMRSAWDRIINGTPNINGNGVSINGMREDGYYCRPIAYFEKNPLKVRATRANANHPWATSWNNTIHLPKRCRTNMIVLHEFSHLLSHEEPSHGRQFCRIFADFIKEFVGQEAYFSLLDSYKRYKVKWGCTREGLYKADYQEEIETRTAYTESDIQLIKHGTWI